MLNKTPEPFGLELQSEGIQELIYLTNRQFGFWGTALAQETNEKIRAGDLMDFWFIMSALATNPPEFRLNKKDAFTRVPNLKPETVRKYVAAAGKLGFVETVKSKGTVYLQLSSAGQKAVASTLAEWVAGFGKIHEKYFKITENL